MNGTPRHGRFKDVCIADLANTPDYFFLFEAVNDGLNRGVCRSVFCRKRFLNISNRTSAASPQRFHDIQLEPGQLRQSHSISPNGEYVITTTTVCALQD